MLSVPPVQIHRQAGVCRIAISDDPVFHDFAFASGVLASLGPEDRIVELDLTRVECLHSPGLANLVQIHIQICKRGGRLRLAGLNAMNRQLLATTRLDGLFEVASA
jgi:anti-anti-sigma factor